MNRSKLARWIRFFIFAVMLSVGPVYSAEASQEPKTKIFNCMYGIGFDMYWTTIVTTVSEKEATRQWAQYAKNNGATGQYPNCTGNLSTDGKPYPSIAAAESHFAAVFANWKRARPHRIQWTPDEVQLEEIASKTKRKSVSFRAPRADEGRGFQGATFDIEYQLIACGGELHLAYSLVKDSVRGKQPAYLFQSAQEGSPSWHEVASSPPQVDAVHLKGMVYIPPFTNEPIGRYSDAFAGQSLGFGCFTGQTKKIANLKDHLGDNPSEEKIQAFINKLAVSFHTNDVLTSQAAEAEIREGKARQTAAPREAQAEADSGPTAAELRAQRHAEVEARNAAAMKKYQEELAKQQQAVADFKAAEERVAAEKAAQAARAKAVQDDYERQQAAHAAEMERHRQQQAEYEAQLAAPGSVKKPQ